MKLGVNSADYALPLFWLVLAITVLVGYLAYQGLMKPLLARLRRSLESGVTSKLPALGRRRASLVPVRALRIRGPRCACVCLIWCVAWPVAAQPADAAILDCARSFKSAAIANDASSGKILLLGDSTVIGNTLRFVKPDGPHLEKSMKASLDAEPDMPAFRIVNLGIGGEYIRQFLSSGRYDATVARQQGVHIVMLRFGLNDYFRLPAFAIDFPSDYERLIQRLRADHPRAALVMMTVIPYHSPQITAAINDSIRRIAQAQGLPLLDTHGPYAAALRGSPHRQSYRMIPLQAIPDNDLPAVAGHVHRINGIQQVVVLDDALDQRLGTLPQWNADRHPNFEGYRVIGEVSSRYISDCIRASRR